MATVAFPKALKRCPKVRRGPRAQLLQFPTGLTGDSLRKRWAWLQHNHRHWQAEEKVGEFDDERETAFALDFGAQFAAACGKQFTEATMRSDIANWSRDVEKRIAVKDWLQRLGVNWADVRTTEQALTFAFECSQNANLPASA